MSFTSLLVPKISVYCLLLSTRSMPESCRGPGDIPRHARPLGRVILALPSVCLGGPTFSGPTASTRSLLSRTESMIRERGPRVSDLDGQARGYCVSERQDPTHRPSRRTLEDGVRWHRRRKWPRWAEHGWTASRSRPARLGARLGGSHTFSMVVRRRGGPSISLAPRSVFCWSAARSAHIAPGRTSMMPELLEGFSTARAVCRCSLDISVVWGRHVCSAHRVYHVLQICCPLLCQGEASVAQDAWCLLRIGPCLGCGGRVTGSQARCVWRLGAPTDQAFGGENRREKEDTVLCGPCTQWATVLEKI